MRQNPMCSGAAVLRIRRVLFANAVAAQFLCGVANTLADTSISASIKSGGNWTGYGDDFNPNWVGETKQIYWQPPAGSPSYSGVMISSGINGFGNMSWENRPIKLLSSIRTATTDTVARTDYAWHLTTAEYGATPRQTTSGEFTARSANYAEVINQDQLTLARGWAVGEQRSVVADNLFIAQGRIGAGSVLEKSFSGASESTALGESALEARYEVREPVAFRLAGGLGGSDDVDFQISIVDYRTNRVLYDFTRSLNLGQNGSWQIDLAGTLAPGTYEIRSQANTDAAVRAENFAAVDYGGEGDFSLAFTAAPVANAATLTLPTFATANAQIAREAEEDAAAMAQFLKTIDPSPLAAPRWPASSLFSQSLILISGSTTTIAANSDPTTVPEPSTVFLVISGVGGILFRRRRVRGM